MARIWTRPKGHWPAGKRRKPPTGVRDCPYSKVDRHEGHAKQETTMTAFKVRFDEAIRVHDGIGHIWQRAKPGDWQAVQAPDIAAADAIACDMALALGRSVYVTVRSLATVAKFGEAEGRRLDLPAEERFYLFRQQGE